MTQTPKRKVKLAPYRCFLQILFWFNTSLVISASKFSTMVYHFPAAVFRTQVINKPYIFTCTMYSICWILYLYRTWENVHLRLHPVCIPVVVISCVQAVRNISKQLQARTDTKQELARRFPQAKPILISYKGETLTL